MSQPTQQSMSDLDMAVSIYGAGAGPACKRVEEWETMDTAPTDGDEIDLWAVSPYREDGRRFPDCKWRSGGWLGLPRNPLKWAPTHWRYPPEPPEMSDFNHETGGPNTGAAEMHHAAPNDPPVSSRNDTGESDG